MATPQISTVEALIARCLTDPDFLESAIQDPLLITGQMSGPLQREALAMDFRKLRRFSGFIGKVQHNYLWEHFPATRRLLWKLGIEHDVFADYRKVQLSPLHSAADRESRLCRFAEFLERYAAEGTHPLLRCVFTHERILRELRATPAAAPVAKTEERRLPWTQFQRLVPTVPPAVRVAKFDLDPMRAMELIETDAPLPRIKRKPITLVYALGVDSKVRMLTPDPVSAMVLALATGRDSVRKLTGIVRQAGLGEVQPSAFREVFEQAVAAGLLRWEAQP